MIPTFPRKVLNSDRHHEGSPVDDPAPRLDFLPWVDGAARGAAHSTADLVRYRRTQIVQQPPSSPDERRVVFRAASWGFLLEYYPQPQGPLTGARAARAAEDLVDEGRLQRVGLGYKHVPSAMYLQVRSGVWAVFLLTTVGTALPHSNLVGLWAAWWEWISWGRFGGVLLLLSAAIGGSASIFHGRGWATWSIRQLWMPTDAPLTRNANLTPLFSRWRWVYAPLLLAALPALARMEEELFREGTHSMFDAIARSLLFGLVHLLVCVPLGAVPALSCAGLFFSFWYFRGGAEASTAAHTTWNLVLLLLLLPFVASRSTAERTS